MDEALLLWINQGWANHGLDVFFSALSSRRGFALPLAVVLLLIFLWRWRKAGMQLWLVMLVVVGLGDFMGNKLKHVFAQHRPCYTVAAKVRQLHYAPGQPCGASLTGMPSNHALNGFTLAAFLTLVLRRRAWSIVLFAIAFSVALSRVYLAKHYPSQIAVGALLGSLWGFIAAWLGLKYLPFMQRFRDRHAAETRNHDQD
jgi:undecaprenyl-diphosphatase